MSSQRFWESELVEVFQTKQRNLRRELSLRNKKKREITFVWSCSPPCAAFTISSCLAVACPLSSPVDPPCPAVRADSRARSGTPTLGWAATRRRGPRWCKNDFRNMSRSVEVEGVMIQSEGNKPVDTNLKLSRFDIDQNGLSLLIAECSVNLDSLEESF